MTWQEQVAGDIGRFLHELQSETDRGLPLVAAAVLEEKLLLALRCFFCVGKSADNLLVGYNAPLGTFSARSDACHALGLIDDFEAKEITLVRKVRNEFAHAQLGLTFESEPVRSFCASLASPMPNNLEPSALTPRFRFILATVHLITRLYWRHTYIEPERRKIKVWYDSKGEWRSGEVPPDGPGSYIVIAHGERKPK
jgi:mannitol operon repressor